MSHTDPEILALRALGEPAGTAADDAHAASCAHCRAELARLAEVVQLARGAGPGNQLEPAPPQVWRGIAAAAGAGPAADTDLAAARPEATAGHGNGHQGTAQPAGRRGRRPAFRLRRELAALAAGLAIGIGATAGVVQLTRNPPARVVAQVELRPLPQFPQWQGASGTAVMRTTAGRQVMAVTLRAPARPGFYEVWLLARNGVSMISLGELDADHTGTFTIPSGTDLRDYSRIDVSLQPFDGSTQHSKTSVVRGSLPAEALGR